MGAISEIHLSPSTLVSNGASALLPYQVAADCYRTAFDFWVTAAGAWCNAARQVTKPASNVLTGMLAQSARIQTIYREREGSAVPQKEPTYNFLPISIIDREGKTLNIKTSSDILKDFPAYRVLKFERCDEQGKPVTNISTSVFPVPQSGPDPRIAIELGASLLKDSHVVIIAPIDPHYVAPEHDYNYSSWHAATIEVCRQNPGADLIGYSGSCRVALDATAEMSHNPAFQSFKPSSLTLIAGPIHTIDDPTELNEVAKYNPSSLTVTIGDAYEGRTRRIMPTEVLESMMSPEEQSRRLPGNAGRQALPLDYLNQSRMHFLYAPHELLLNGKPVAYSSITCPVLAFIGSEDKLVRYSHLDPVRGMINSAAPFTHQVIHGADHYGMAERPATDIIAGRIHETRSLKKG